MDNSTYTRDYPHMINLNYKYTDSSVIGSENGIDIALAFENYKNRISQIITKINNEKHTIGAGLQWMNFGYGEETSWYVKEYAALVENRFENILILGMEGSAPGGMAITDALLTPYWNFLPDEKRNNFPKIFYLDNIDPDEILGLLEILDLKKTLVNIITKSDSTAETMSQFMIIKDKMEKELGDDYRKNIVATTDKNTGVLRQIAEQEGYKTFVVPDDVGGRFSALSAVGLLPLALTGIDIDEIIRGVKDMDEMLQNTDIHSNIAAQNALIHYLADKQKGKNISVMMPYASRLKSFAKWYIQLWAESLGKEYDLDGNKVHNGQTPVAALGATDQHTQIQLFNEGPNNKIITFTIKTHLPIEILKNLFKI